MDHHAYDILCCMTHCCLSVKKHLSYVLLGHAVPIVCTGGCSTKGEPCCYLYVDSYLQLPRAFNAHLWKGYILAALPAYYLTQKRHAGAIPNQEGSTYGSMNTNRAATNE